MDYYNSDYENDNELDYVVGTVISVIFRNDESGYSVLKVDSNDTDESFTVVGCIPFAYPGNGINAEGKWIKSNEYGLQFKVESADVLLPSGDEALMRYLSGGAIKGIGADTAIRLLDRFGNDVLRIISEEPERLTEIRGISSKKSESIHAEYKKQSVINKLSEYISLYGLRPVLAIRLYRFYGLDAIRIIDENPYILASGQIGGKFSEADRLALDMGFEDYSSNRLKAAAIFELNYNLNNGHCFIPRDKLVKATSSLLNIPDDSVDECIEELINDGSIICEQVAGCDACYIPKIYFAETNCAEKLVALARKECRKQRGIDSFISNLELKEQISYSPAQRESITVASENMAMVITGGPGTGKTTVVRALCALYEKQGLNIVMAAPTGRAAKRLSEISGYEASTIHRLLGAKISDDGETILYDKNETDPIICDVVIIDECSMIDIQLMSALLSAIPVDTRLVLVGDADQLPSVGPGNVFSAVIRSNTVPVVTLNEIFRQGKGSSIVKNAHDINEGIHPDFSDNSGDFFRMKRLNASNTVETIIELFAKRLPENMHIPSSDIQVLSFTRKGELGTVNLNKCIQNSINPAQNGLKEKLFGERVFRVGDKVMQIKNNYDIMWTNEDASFTGHGIYNGEMGYIIDIDTMNDALTIDFDGKIVKYSFDFLSELEHAWAVTVHKAQGNEYPAVILALSDHSSLLLYRGVLYTAITRAKKLFVMVGDDNIADRMIDNFKQNRRYCALRYRMVALCE